MEGARLGGTVENFKIRVKEYLTEKNILMS